MARGKAQRTSKGSTSETVLFAVTGMTPAVLTETVWALAKEKPAILPDRVVVVTTTTGREQIERELFGEAAIWDRLRKAVKAGDRLRFGTTASDIRVFTAADARTGCSRELDDLRTAEDNAAAANFVLEQLRGLAENPDTRILASIAGGRKTMGALLYACMTLIGREGDRVTHVLVNEPFENPRLLPKFYFPGCGPKAVAGVAPRIELADLPFVPLRNRFRDLGEMPGSFAGMVKRYTTQLREDAAHKAVVKLDEKAGTVTVDGVRVELRLRAMQTLRFLLHVNDCPGAMPAGQPEAVAPMKEFLGGAGNWIADQDDLKREISYLRKEFEKQGVAWMPGQRRMSLTLPPFRMKN